MRNSLVLVGVTSLRHVAQGVSRAPPHHTLPAFINLIGTLFSNLKYMISGNTAFRHAPLTIMKNSVKVDPLQK